MIPAARAARLARDLLGPAVAAAEIGPRRIRIDRLDRSTGARAASILIEPVDPAAVIRALEATP